MARGRNLAPRLLPRAPASLGADLSPVRAAEEGYLDLGCRNLPRSTRGRQSRRRGLGTARGKGGGAGARGTGELASAAAKTHVRGATVDFLAL